MQKMQQRQRTVSVRTSMTSESLLTAAALFGALGLVALVIESFADDK